MQPFGCKNPVNDDDDDDDDDIIGVGKLEWLGYNLAKVAR